jgi:hypothetical protein
VQERNGEIGDEDAQGRPQATLARGMEDDATEDRRPQAVTERGQDASNELREDDGWQREGEVPCLDDEERGKRVAATLECGEAKANRRS